jgi:alkanesulfonate monooxygenase SsuD/methylene tetrahydromethanopterin reductase-like flavin-dependent oxidoreductase (luciferase family)
MLGFNVFAADTDEEAKLLATSVQQAFVALRSGRPIQLQPPVRGYADQLGPHERAILADVLACSAIGSPDTVREAVRAFVSRTQADELIIACNMFDHGARLHSYEIAAQVRDSLA